MMRRFPPFGGDVKTVNLDKVDKLSDAILDFIRDDGGYTIAEVSMGFSEALLGIYLSFLDVEKLKKVMAEG